MASGIELLTYKEIKYNNMNDVIKKCDVILNEQNSKQTE